MEKLLEKVLEKVLESGVKGLVWLLTKLPIGGAVRSLPTATLVVLQGVVCFAAYRAADLGLLLSLPSSYPLPPAFQVGIACVAAIATWLTVLLHASWPDVIEWSVSKGGGGAVIQGSNAEDLVELKVWSVWSGLFCAALLIWRCSIADSWVLTAIQAGPSIAVLAWSIPRVYRQERWPVPVGVLVLVLSIFLPRMASEMFSPLSYGSVRYPNLAGADLAGRDLRHLTSVSALDLTAAVLTRADLRGVDLHGALLSGTDLRGANLCGVRGLSQSMLDVARGDQFTRLPRPLRVRCSCTFSVAHELPYADGPSPCATACPAQQPDDPCAD